jgi:hypothetical protein
MRASTSLSICIVLSLAASLTFDSFAIAGRGGDGDSPTSFFAVQASRTIEGEPMLQSTPSNAHVSRGRRSAGLSSHAVCVRLCDGSFFPLNGANASCESECPGAPTQVYHLASGSDQIDGATASNGQRYQDLPIAFRYRTTVDKTCICRGNESATALLQDRTLRNGDLVITSAGVRVLRSDFAEVANSGLPRRQRDLLMAMRP